MKFTDVIEELNSVAKRIKPESSNKFFKTKEGEYGYGDVFIGISVPLQRSIAKKYVSLGLADIKKLLENKIHEYRSVALEILVFKYEKADKTEKEKIVAFYLKNKKYINNWDLVDGSAPYILGDSLIGKKDRSILYTLAKSKNIWERRISIVSTWMLIRNNDFKDTLLLSKMLLSDEHDLMHKAVGWMLREVGKKSEPTLVKFLDQNCTHMPRTALRYAIERFPENKRKEYLSKK